MLIFFNQTTDELAQIASEVVEDATATLLQAHRNGHHLVVVGRETSVWLEEHATLTTSNLATLRRLRAEYTQTFGLIKAAPIYIRISTNHEKQGRVASREISLPITSPDFDKILERAVFVVEDIDADKKCYGLFMECLPGNISHLKFFYEPVHGGGARTLDVAMAKVLEKRIVVAALDSDRDAPCAAQTKKREIERLAALSGWPFLFCMTTPCREVENLIPLPVAATVRTIYMSDTYRKLMHIYAAEARGHSHEMDRFALWFDMKLGTNENVISAISDTSVKAWLTSKIRLLPFAEAQDGISGFGPGYMRQILHAPETPSQLRAQMRTSDWPAAHRDFFEFLRWLFLSAGSQRT
jgi:hypothetical protein